MVLTSIVVMIVILTMLALLQQSQATDGTGIVKDHADTDLRNTNRGLLASGRKKTLYAASMETLRGDTGGNQEVANLHSWTQGGNDNDWNEYVQFQSTSQRYKGHRSYFVPPEVFVKSLWVEVNYVGPAKVSQVWTWRLYNWSLQRWVDIGDNKEAPWWGDWKQLFFYMNDVFDTPKFVHPTSREIRLQVEASNTEDNMALDYEAVHIEYEEVVTHNVVPSSMETYSGSTGNDQTVANLAVKDQSNAQNDWTKFVKFFGTSEIYQGHRTYFLPSSSERIQSLQVKANYRGRAIESQVWTWLVYNWSTRKWVTIGTNEGAPWWGKWHELSFDVRDPEDFVLPGVNEVMVRVQSNIAVDSMDLDYEVVVVKSSSGDDPGVVTYDKDTSHFLNPERGLHHNMPFDAADLRWLRGFETGYTLNAVLVDLSDYRERPIGSELLNTLRARLTNARESGIKLVLRFGYSNPGQTDDYTTALDATEARVLEHIGQLGPVLSEQSDVILALEAGFIGAWGEWHASSNGLDEDPTAQANIVKALLRAMPSDRMILLRNLEALTTIHPHPLSESDAYSGSNQARTGHHNDCFLSNPYDSGTYRPEDKAEFFKTYLDSSMSYLPMGGETCHETPSLQRTDCVTTLSELARYHWTYLADFYYQPAIAQWKEEGCYDDIAKFLGYRYRLIKTSRPQPTWAGSMIQFSLTMTNDGWANIFNPRDVNIVLRRRTSGIEVTIPVDIGDARRALPQPGVTKSLDVVVVVPTWVESGMYDIFLALPDPSERLRKDPRYNIRLANVLNGETIWEDDSGYNALGVSVEVL